MLGDWQAGVTLCQQSLDIHRAIRNPQGEGEALNYLGYAYARGGQFDKAIAMHQQGIRILKAGGYRLSLLEALVDLAETYLLAGQPTQARQTAEEALQLARELGAKRYEALAAWNLGLAYETLGDCARAAEWMQIRVDYERAIGHPDAEKHAQHLAQVRARAEQGDC